MLGRITAIICLLALPVQAEQLGPRLSGEARMGLVWSDRDSRLGPRESGIRMSSRARLKFHFEGETDGGLRFGGEFNLDRPDQRRPIGQFHIGG